MSENIVRTREFFHEYAGGFNSIYSNKNTAINRFVNERFRKSMELRYHKTLEGCNPIEDKRVLDLGCGPGHYGIALARAGAGSVLGVDFAEGMIELARKQAVEAGVANKCTFQVLDFFAYKPEKPFDYVVVMGVMDYIPEPRPFVEHVLSMTQGKAFFSFPASGGLLGWQRQLRYKSRCPLYLYSEEQVTKLFQGIPNMKAKVEPIARDFFVEVSRV